MRIKIFDVEHGGCALVVADTGSVILIDCGHNSTTGWRPSTYLPSVGIDTIDWLIITNFDEDHASDLRNLRQTVAIRNLYRNGSVSPDQLLGLKELGGIGPGIQSLQNMMRTYTAAPHAVDLGQLTITTFNNDYPYDFEDENNLSMVTLLKQGALCIAFPGDLEKQGWAKLLERQDFRLAMSEVNFLVASHHGRANGCSEALYNLTGMMPIATIISDSGIEFASQETIAWYRQRSSGFMLNGEFRRVLTTRRDGRIQIDSMAEGIFVNVF